MASLENQQIKDTYQGIVKTNDNQELPLTGQVPLTDGNGNESAISIGRAGEGITVTGGISGATFELGAKTFSVDEVIVPAVVGDPIQFKFGLTGETPEVVEIKIYRGYSKLPTHVYLLYNVQNNTYYSVGAGVEFGSAEYFCECKALYADNTYVTAIAPFITLDTRVGSISVQLDSLTYYNPSNMQNAIYPPLYNAQQAGFSSLPVRKFYASFLWEAVYTITLSPFDFLNESTSTIGFGSFGQPPGQLNANWIGQSSSGVSIIYPYPSLPLFTRTGDSTYQVVAVVGNNSGYNQLNNASKAFDMLFRCEQANVVIDDVNNKISSVGTIARLNSFIQDTSSAYPSIPYEIYIRYIDTYTHIGNLPSTTDYVYMYFDFVGIDFAAGWTRTTYDATGTTVLWQVSDVFTYSQRHEIPNFVLNDSYVIEFTGVFLDGSPFTLSETITLYEATGTIDNYTVGNKLVEAEATVNNMTMYNRGTSTAEQSIQFAIVDSGGNDVATSRYTRTSGLPTAYSDQPLYQTDLINQYYSAKLELPQTQPAGTYTLELRLSYKYYVLANGTNSYVVADSTTFVLT